MLPLRSPQSFQLPHQGVSDDDDDILQSHAIPSLNMFFLLTRTRIFLYQAKPLAPIAFHKRTSEAINVFGHNKTLRDNLNYGNIVNGLSTEGFSDPAVGDRWYFYVITENNFILVYQISTRTTEKMVFREYGVTTPNLNEELMEEKPNDGNNDDVDDEILTVYDIKEDSRIIQNGYALSKQRGFFHFLNSAEMNDELPIRTAELRLHVVLKFDHDILDVMGVMIQQHPSHFLMVLFKHGLQLLKLEDFKLIENNLIQVEDGIRLFFSNKSIYVLSKNENIYLFNTILFEEEKIEVQKIFTADSSQVLTAATIFYDILLLSFGKTLVYYDLDSKIKENELILPERIVQITKLSDDYFAFLTEGNSIMFISKWGNVIQTASIAGTENLNHLSTIDGKLLVVGAKGFFHYWDFWRNVSPSFSNFRSNKTFCLVNDNNDILLYSQMGEAVNTSAFQTIKLPTKTLNNYVTHCEINGSLSLLAVYISNKKILLVNVLNTNTWLTFENLILTDCYWVEEDYLLCHLEDEESGTQTLECFYFPLTAPSQTKNLEDLRIWSWEVHHTLKVKTLSVNTLSDYKLLKIKEKKNSTSMDIDTDKVLYKTAEILVTLSNSTVVVFDVISSIHPAGINLIRKFHQLGSYDLPEHSLKGLKWLYKYKDGFIAWISDQLVRIGRQEDGEWKFSIAFDRIENILEIVGDNIVLISGNNIYIYSFEFIWAGDDPLITIPILEEEYPISISLDTATVHNISSVTTENSARLSVSHGIYLDQIVARSLALGTDITAIDLKYHDLKHYKFSLEKILSSKILAQEDLKQILSLIDAYDFNTDGVVKEVGKLDIIGNCLRKIETKHWEFLFQNLELTPKDLITRSIELAEPKILGSLLMVFLNYDDNVLEPSIQPKTSKKEKKKGRKHRKNGQKDSKETSSVPTLLKDDELILQVLRIFVSAASLSPTREQALQYWDFALQLIRFLRALDSKSDSNIVERCLELL